MVGGAPVYVMQWDAYGGAHATITIDQNAIDRAGQAGNYRFVHKHPMNGWPISDEMRNVYLIAGAAAVYVATPKVVAGITPSRVAWNDINRNHNTAPYDNVLYRPLSPTYVRGVQSGEVYQVVNAVPHFLPSWSYVGGAKEYVNIDQVAIDRAGTTGMYLHLLPVGAPVPAP